MFWGSGWVGVWDKRREDRLERGWGKSVVFRVGKGLFWFYYKFVGDLSNWFFYL